MLRLIYPVCVVSAPTPSQQKAERLMYVPQAKKIILKSHYELQCSSPTLSCIDYATAAQHNTTAAAAVCLSAPRPGETFFHAQLPLPLFSRALDRDRATAAQRNTTTHTAAAAAAASRRACILHTRPHTYLVLVVRRHHHRQKEAVDSQRRLDDVRHVLGLAPLVEVLHRLSARLLVLGQVVAPSRRHALCAIG